MPVAWLAHDPLVILDLHSAIVPQGHINFWTNQP